MIREGFLYLAEITAYDVDLRATRILRYSNEGWRTSASDSPAHTLYDARLTQPISVTRSIFAPGTTQGQSKVGYGDLVLANPDGELDALLPLAFDGRPIRVLRGELSAATLADFTPVFVGTMEQAEFSVDTITIKLRDAQAPLNLPLQTVRYGGTNVLPAGLDGVAGDLAGKPKPLLFGRIFNATPAAVNTARLIYQLHDGALASVDEVYDRGAPLTYGGAYASLVDLQNDALEPAESEYKVYLAGGYLRLGSSPDGTITCDATEGATVADRTAAQLYARVLDRAGIASGDIASADLVAADAVADGECGIYLDSDITTASVCDQIAATIGAWWGVSAAGTFRFVQLVRPMGDAVRTFTANDLIGAPVRQSLADPERGVPAYRVTARYERNYTVQTSDVAGAVDDARRAVLAQPWREAVASDASVLAVHVLAVPLTIDTLFANVADAEVEAARVLALRSIQRHRFEIMVQLMRDTVELDLGDVIGLAHPRYGLTVFGDDVGQRFTVIGVLPDARAGTLRLTLWGNSFTTHNLITDEDALFVSSAGDYLVTGSF